MNQSKVRSTNLSRVESQMIMMDRSRKGVKQELMSQVTMRKSGSAIQIVQRVVNGKDNSSSGGNNLNTMKSYNNNMIVNKDKLITTQRTPMTPTNNTTITRNNSTTTTNSTSFYPQPQQHQDKMQQLKNRFKRIKSSYDQTHQILIMGNNKQQLTVMESSSSFGMNQSRKSCGEGGSSENGNNNYGCYYKQDGNANNELTYNYSDSIARHSPTLRFGSTSQLQPTLQTNPNDISFNCDSSLPPSSYRNSDHHQFDMKDKYRSLTKQLSSFQHSELISLLVEEMEDNEKNKQFVEKSRVELERREVERRQLVKELGLQREEGERLKLLIKQLQLSSSSQSTQSKQPTYQSNKLKSQQQYLLASQKQIQKQNIQIQKLRKQLQTKRQQMQILLETEKKNLGIIQKLKRVNKMCNSNLNSNVNSNSASSSNLLQVQQHFLQQQITINSNSCNNNNSNNNNSNNNNSSSNNNNNNSHNKSKSFSTILNQQKCTSHIHPCEQKSLSMSHILPGQYNINMDYKQKHDELQQYMNEYIASVNQTYNQYQRTLSELRELNCQLKDTNKQLINQNSMLSSRIIMLTNQNGKLIPHEHNLTSQLGNMIDKNQLLQEQVVILKDENVKLANCITNSKLVIVELQQQFSLLKNENAQLKQLLQSSNQQNSHLMTSNNQSIKQLNLLSVSNQRLLNQNQQLIRDMTELQSKAISNTQVQQQIRSIVQELTENKFEQQGVIQQQVGVINNLKQQINQKSSQLARVENIVQLKSNQLRKNISQLNAIKSHLTQSQLTQQQLTHKLQLTTQSNKILQQTVSQMTQLVTGLISQHRELNQRQNNLKMKLIEIMNQVKTMQSAYQWQSVHKQSMRQMLALFWQKQGQLLHNQKLSNSFTNTYSNTSSLTRGNSIKNTIHISRTKSQGSAIFNNNRNNNNNNQQSCQISFKKGSVITKQGSSSILLNNNNNKLSHISSDIKSSIQQPIIESSAISHKYYSSQIQDNFNINCDNSDGDSRCDGDSSSNVLKQASSRINVNNKQVDVSNNGWKDKLIKGTGHKRTVAQLQ